MPVFNAQQKSPGSIVTVQMPVNPVPQQITQKQPVPTPMQPEGQQRAPIGTYAPKPGTQLPADEAPKQYATIIPHSGVGLVKQRTQMKRRYMRVTGHDILPIVAGLRDTSDAHDEHHAHVLADFLEEGGMPETANVIRRHFLRAYPKETNPGAYRSMPNTGAPVKPVNPGDWTVSVSGRNPGEVKYLRIDHLPADSKHNGFGWDMRTDHEEAEGIVDRLLGEGHIPGVSVADYYPDLFQKWRRGGYSQQESEQMKRRYARQEIDQYFANSLGIKREDAPQIPDDRKEKFLKELQDEGIGHANFSVGAGSLKPSQLEWNEDSLKKVQSTLKAGGSEAERMQKNRVTVSSDGYVLDGHHRWLEACLSGRKLNIVRINLPIRDLIEKAREFGVRNGIDTKKAKMKRRYNQGQQVTIEEKPKEKPQPTFSEGSHSIGEAKPSTEEEKSAERERFLQVLRDYRKSRGLPEAFRRQYMRHVIQDLYSRSASPFRYAADPDFGMEAMYGGGSTESEDDPDIRFVRTESMLPLKTKEGKPTPLAAAVRHHVTGLVESSPNGHAFVNHAGYLNAVGERVGYIPSLSYVTVTEMLPGKGLVALKDRQKNIREGHPGRVRKVTLATGAINFDTQKSMERLTGEPHEPKKAAWHTMTPEAAGKGRLTPFSQHATDPTKKDYLRVMKHTPLDERYFDDAGRELDYERDVAPFVPLSTSENPLEIRTIKPESVHAVKVGGKTYIKSDFLKVPPEATGKTRKARRYAIQYAARFSIVGGPLRYANQEDTARKVEDATDTPMASQEETVTEPRSNRAESARRNAIARHLRKEGRIQLTGHPDDLAIAQHMQGNGWHVSTVVDNVGGKPVAVNIADTPQNAHSMSVSHASNHNALNEIWKEAKANFARAGGGSPLSYADVWNHPVNEALRKERDDVREHGLAGDFGYAPEVGKHFPLAGTGGVSLYNAPQPRVAPVRPMTPDKRLTTLNKTRPEVAGMLSPKPIAGNADHLKDIHALQGIWEQAKASYNRLAAKQGKRQITDADMHDRNVAKRVWGFIHEQGLRAIEAAKARGEKVPRNTKTLTQRGRDIVTRIRARMGLAPHQEVGQEVAGSGGWRYEREEEPQQYRGGRRRLKTGAKVSHVARKDAVPRIQQHFKSKSKLSAVESEQYAQRRSPAETGIVVQEGSDGPPGTTYRSGGIYYAPGKAIPKVGV